MAQFDFNHLRVVSDKPGPEWLAFEVCACEQGFSTPGMLSARYFGGYHSDHRGRFVSRPKNEFSQQLFAMMLDSASTHVVRPTKH